MRLSTLQTYNNGLNSILSAQEAVNKTQQQVSSGRRVLTPADDPIASTKILQLQQDLAQREQYETNMVAFNVGRFRCISAEASIRSKGLPL